MDLARRHEATTGEKVKTLLADSKYGTIDNYLACRDAGIDAHNSIGIFDKTPFYRTINVLRLTETAF